MLQWALKYLEAGMSVIPLKPRSKEPLIKWEEYQTRKPTETEVKGWFGRCPLANLGIVTGVISNLVVIDVDGPDGFITSDNLKLNSLATVLTGKGKQLYFKHAGGNICNAVRKWPGIDIRGDGGFVVAPPSIHPNGLRYRWGTTPVFSALSTIPTTIYQEVVTASKCQKPIITNGESWIAKALGELKNGNRNDSFTRIVGKLHRDLYSPDDIRGLLLPSAKLSGFEERELDQIIDSITSKPRETRLHMATDSAMLLVIHSPTNPDSVEQYRRGMSLESAGEGLKTGYSKLDKMLIGGLKSSRLFTVAARTGTGKTNWIISAARFLCEAGSKVLLFSTETPFQSIWARYLATIKDTEKFKQHRFFVCDSFTPSIERIEEAIKQVMPDVFIFDHINHVSEEYIALGQFMQGLNYLRRKYECAGIVTAQLNRAADFVDMKTGEKIIPRMSMIKGSGTIEQASSRVLLLSESRVTDGYTEIVGNLDKNDNGPKGLVHFGLFNNPWEMRQL